MFIVVEVKFLCGCRAVCRMKVVVGGRLKRCMFAVVHW